MASTLSRPENSVAWFINGDQLGLVKKKFTSNSSDYVAFDESVTDGLLLHYYGDPVPIAFDELDQPMDLPPALYDPMVDYIKSVLFRDQAGALAAVNPELAQVNLNLAATHERLYRQELKRNIVSLTTRKAGPRHLVAFPLSQP